MIICVVLYAVAQSDKDQLLTAIHHAYESNRSILSTYGSARFEFSIGTSRDIDSVKSGKWSPTATATARCLYAYDGTNFRYERLFSMKDMVAQRRSTPDGGWTSTLDSIRLLSNGSTVLWDGIVPGADDTEKHGVEIMRGPEPFFAQVVFPLGLGNGGATNYQLHKDIERSRATPGEFRVVEVDGAADLGGRGVVYIQFATAELEREYWVDIERAAIPLRMKDTSVSGTGSFEIDYSDLRWVGEKGWLPFTQVILLSDGMAKKLEIREADFAAKPGASTFELDFPEPIPMIDSARMLRYAPQRTWNLNKLPASGSGHARPIEVVQPPAMAPRLAKEATDHGWALWAIGIGGVITVLAVLVRIRKG